MPGRPGDPERTNNFDLGDSSSTLLRNTAGYRFNTQDNNDCDAGPRRLHVDGDSFAGRRSQTEPQ